MLAGAPGSGKTILIQQMCFAWAERYRQSDKDSNTASRKKVGSKNLSKGSRAIYFSTLSEPHDKLLQNISQFSFFNPDLLVDNIKLFSLTSVMEQGLEKVGDLIVNTVRQEHAGFIAIDGFRALEGLANDVPAVRRFLYRLSAQLNMLGTTIVISLERTLSGNSSEGDLTIADGLIGMYSIIEGAREYHRVEIRKLRGMPRLLGRHSYNITTDGLTFFPRIESQVQPELTSDGAGADDVRLKFSVPELDQMLGGGLPRGSTTLLAGSPGVGKSILGIQFLLEGARLGQKGLYLGFHESKSQIINKAARFNLPMREAVEQGEIILLTRNAAEIEPDEIVALLKDRIERNSIQRLVLDDLAELNRATVYENRTHDFLSAVITYIKTKDITLVSCYTVSKLVGTELDLSNTPLGLLAENLLLLRKIEAGNLFFRTLAVLYMRDSSHDFNTHEYTITDQIGIQLLPGQSSQLYSRGSE